MSHEVVAIRRQTSCQVSISADVLICRRPRDLRSSVSSLGCEVTTLTVLLISILERNSGVLLWTAPKIDMI